MEEYQNGSKILAGEIELELDKKGLSQRDRLLLRGILYLLKETPITRTSLVRMDTDIKKLEKHNIVLWVQAHPKTAVFVAAGILIVNSMINWAGLRRPILQGVIHATTGVIIPLENLP